MSVIEDMCEITHRHAEETLRFFTRTDASEPSDADIDVLYLREDLAWTDRRQAVVESELLELVASEAYEYRMDAENLNQIIKVADDQVLFTGFVEDAVVVAAFERGIFPVLPSIVAEFRTYMLDNDVEFISLDVPQDRQ